MLLIPISSLLLQRLQEEARWLMVVEYVRALMQKRLVCRNAKDRTQLAQQMIQDDQQFRELFHGLVRRGGLLWLVYIDFRCGCEREWLLANYVSPYVSPATLLGEAF